jgi:GT2 family glycosyltransferase
MNYPSVAVVILNWNGKHWLEQFLPSVIKSTYPNLQIIVGDNFSTDTSIEFLTTYYPQIKIIKNNSNLGFAGGYNEVLKSVSANYYLLLNSDVEVVPNWIEPMVAKLETDDLIAACQPKIMCFDDKKKFEYAGAAGGFIDRLGYPFCRGRVFDTLETDNGQYDKSSEIFWASGACFLIRSSIYNKLGGFDADFFAHQEEIDLCWRIKNLNLKIYFIAESKVYHVGGGMLPKSNPFKTYLNFRNSLFAIYKNTSALNGILILIARLLLDALAGFKFLISGNSKDCHAIIKAHWSFFANIKTLHHKRGLLHKTGLASNKLTGWYNGSIVWDYFIKKKTTFTQLMT